MTNTGGVPAGWYYAPGDPEGTHRYWDGAQWIGEPQPVPQPPPAPPAPPAPAAPAAEDMTVQYRPSAGFDVPSAGQPPGGFAAPGAGAGPDYSAPGVAGAGATSPPNYGAPGGQSGQPAGSAPPVYQGAAVASGTPGTPAEWGTRAIAYLIDWGIGVGILVAGLILGAIGGAIVDALGILIIVVTYLAVIAYGIWNWIVKQGTTGQSIGKEKQGIKLVKDETGEPVGPGMAFVRYLLASLISGVTCGIYGILDILWPLWDPQKKRLTDKIVTMSVIVA